MQTIAIGKSTGSFEIPFYLNHHDGLRQDWLIPIKHGINVLPQN